MAAGRGIGAITGGSLKLSEITLRGQLLHNEPLSRHTSLKVGGPVDCFAVPEDMTDLLGLLQQLEAHGFPWFIIGGGYNLLVGDGGFRGVAISLKRINRIAIEKGVLHAEAGATNQAVAAFARDNGMSGLEFLVGIPGTLGGALRMNAGAHGNELFDSVVSVEMVSEGVNQKYAKHLLKFGYRCLQLDTNKIIIAADICCKPAPRESIVQLMESCLDKRKETQKVNFPNAGSFFKNPANHAAWRLIDEAGMRGFSVGGAQVSEVHTNFLVNCGKATAADFIKLAAIVKEQVLRKSNILLEEEVIMIGEQGS
ncbi:UDP-N-acetylmuramate dehydrogenase [Pelotalea chapellei]|uniref:UDP-N-acetylenolpyruvoylglucosamine reductase n=1 Tax=Pelotalea chapellei TaxID=44671 RepID=A0ABS5U8U4_9BACT|nr:UDP-N-acetylmuramate dehydrogenase [Pelotalea chapellei]MBT1072089.1 UDP-N-acetylmuramate dehydrogenase [Pelotalea chapellei]